MLYYRMLISAEYFKPVRYSNAWLAAKSIHGVSRVAYVTLWLRLKIWGSHSYNQLDDSRTLLRVIYMEQLSQR
jgi:hypothetical protein